MGWDEVLSTLVGFVGREVVVQVLDGTPSAAPPILTATGTLADSDPSFEGALATDTVLVRLTRVDEVSAVVSLTRELFRGAEMVDHDDLEMTFASMRLGICAS